MGVHFGLELKDLLRRELLSFIADKVCAQVSLLYVTSSSPRNWAQ